MLEIKAYSKLFETYLSLDLGENQTIQYVSDSGLLDFDKLPGSYVLPLNIPKSINNNRIFEFAFKNSISLSDNIFKIPCEVYINYHLLFSGVLFLNDCTEYYNCSIAVDQGVFNDENNQKKLFEFYGSNPEQSIPFTFPSEQIEGPDVYEYCLPLIGNNKFYEGHTYESEALPAQNAYDVIEEAYSVTFRTDCFSAVTPFLYLYKVINKIFEQYNLTENCFDSGEFKRLCIYNNVNAANIHRNHLGVYTISISNFVPANHLPEITINEFLLSLKNYFCCALIQRNGKTRLIFLKDIIASNSYIEISKRALDNSKKYIFDKVQNVWIQPTNDSADANLSQIKPLSNFIQSPNDRIFPAFPSTYEGNTYKFNEIIIQDKDAYNDPLLIKYVRILHHYYGSDPIYPAGLDSITNPIVDYRYTYANGYYSQNPPHKIFRSGVSQTYWEPQNEHPYSLYINQKGNDNRWFTGIPAIDPPAYNAFNLRFLFDHGWVEDSNGVISWKYPHASMDSNVLSLCFHHERGLVNVFWKDYLAMLSAQNYYLEQPLNLSIADIKNFDHTKKYRLNGRDYIVTKFKVNINSDGSITPALCTMYPVIIPSTPVVEPDYLMVDGEFVIIDGDYVLIK